MNNDRFLPNDHSPEKHSAFYVVAEEIILRGIEKSKQNGYKDVKVTFMRPDEYSSAGSVEVTMLLEEFWGGNSLYKLLNKNTKELDALVVKYNQPEFVRQTAQKKDVHRAIGEIASRSPYKSGEKFVDGKSAGGNSHLED